jgi:hypothetical protein
MKSGEFWERVASEPPVQLRMVGESSSPLLIGDAVNIGTAEGPNQVEQTAINQLAHRFRVATAGIDPDQWLKSLRALPQCRYNITEQPVTTLLRPVLSTTTKTIDTSRPSVAIVLPFDPPGFSGAETPARMRPPTADEMDAKRKVGIGLTFLWSIAYRMRLERFGTNNYNTPIRRNLVTRYIARTAQHNEDGIVQRRPATDERIDRQTTLLGLEVESNDTAEKVARAALRWSLENPWIYRTRQ